MSAPRLSACLIVRDEAEHLPHCLASLAGVVHETILVDTGSTDASPELARQYGARVLHVAWQDDFSHARNASLDAAQGDWILVIDADEALTHSARERLPHLLATTEADALTVLRRDLAPPGSPQRWSETRITRLWRRDRRFRYEGRVHEQIRPAIERSGGRLEDTDLTLLHWGYLQPTAQGESRVERNLTLLEAALHDAPDDPYLHVQIGIAYKAAGRSADAEEALARATELGAERSLLPETLATLWTKRAQIALAADRHRRARACARRALGYAPDHFLAHYVAAVACLFAGDVAAACPHLRAARAHDACSDEEADRLDRLIVHCPD